MMDVPFSHNAQSCRRTAGWQYDANRYNRRLLTVCCAIS